MSVAMMVKRRYPTHKMRKPKTFSPAAIKRMREASTWKQRECAEYIGVALRTWQAFEAGTHEPSLCHRKMMEFLEAELAKYPKP